MKKYPNTVATIWLCLLFIWLNTGISRASSSITGTIGGNQTIEFGCTPTVLTNLDAPAPPLGKWTQQWQSSTDSVSWTPIAGATGLSYQPGALTQTTYYRRMVKMNLNLAYYSNIVCVKVQPLYGGKISGDQAIASGAKPDMIRNVEPTKSPAETFTYSWQKSIILPGLWQAIPGNGESLQPESTTTPVYYRRVVTHTASSQKAYSNVVCITIDNGVIIPGSIEGNQEIVSGSRPAEIRSTTPPQVGEGMSYNISWEQGSSANGGWTPISQATGLTYQPDVLSRTQYFRRKVSRPSDGKYAYSNVVCIKVVPGTITASTDKSYVMTKTPYVEASKTASLSVKECLTTIQYFDGLGRSLGKNQVGITPNYFDLISLQEYNGAGNESKSWLPIITTGNGSFPNPVSYHLLSVGFYDDNYAYKETEYEKNPLSRVTGNHGPGSSWVGKYMKTDYTTNYMNSSLFDEDFEIITDQQRELMCCLYVEESNKLRKKGYYPNRDLYVAKYTDEDGNYSFEFKDKQGRLVLSRQVSGGARFDTYYVYDDMSNLRFVLPPMASDSLDATDVLWDETTSKFIDGYAYLYRYDKRQRCTQKKLPGADWIYYVYDKADRLIFTQDGNQRASNPNEWTFSIPDAMGRTVLTGTCETYNGKPIAPGCLDEAVVTASYEESASTPDYMGYELANFTLGGTKLLSVDYYDSYDFITDPVVGQNFSGVRYSAIIGFDARNATANQKGLLTGKVVFPLDDAIQETCEQIYYDSRKRIVQSVRRNHLGGISRHLYKYDFAGNILAEREIHQTAANSREDVLDRTYRYDHARRLIGDSTVLNNGTPAVVTYAYDELGRRSVKCYGSGTGILTESFAYNIRGWLTRQTSSVFDQRLYYQDRSSLDPTHPVSYSGNISAVEWQRDSSNSVAYLLCYDALCRLSGTNRYANGVLDNRFGETNVQYDKNGNITRLDRYSPISSEKLKYLYTPGSNQLQAIVGSGSLCGFAYDANGNMVEDGMQKVTVSYNKLNLPARFANAPRSAARSVSNGNLPEIAVPGATRALYCYAADGELKRVVDGSDKGLEYLGSLIYIRNGNVLTLESAPFSEGRIKPTSGGQEVNYHVIDHLGSVRSIVDDQGKVRATHDYTPFGSGASLSMSLTGNDRYRFNGKELQSFVDLDMLNYGARMYNSGLCRWSVPDPKSEKYYSQSPYSFCANNPLKYVDPDGKEFVDHNGVKIVITYNRNGTLSFSKNATPDVIRAANALYLTPTGRTQLKRMDRSDIKVYLSISSESNIHQRSDGKTKYTYGKAVQGNYNENDNYGKKLNPDGTYGIKEASIVVYEGTIKEQLEQGNGKHRGLTLEQAIGAVVGHEGVHATDKSEIHKDIKAEMRDRLRDDRETVPNRIEQQIINESKTLNNPLWWIGL